ncbi:MAG: hypothetical protein U0L17_05450 [Acutalibacteraceae bacterium]|nr:hypothetical protein [Acutalibacteraceae bacterium]
MKKVIKWLSNYWYHYKFRTIFFAFLAIIVAVTVVEFATRESYDMKVYLYMSQFASTDVEQALEDTIEETFAKNGEEMNVQVINLSYDPYSVDGDSRMSYAAALTGELRMKDDFLYITDEYRFSELNENETFDNVFSKEEMFDKYDNKAYLLKGSNFEKNFIKNLEKHNVSVEKMPNLYISLLSPPEKDSKNFENYENSKRLAKMIIDMG